MEHISQLFVYIVDFEQVNVCWEISLFMVGAAEIKGFFVKWIAQLKIVTGKKHPQIKLQRFQSKSMDMNI